MIQIRLTALESETLEGRSIMNTSNFRPGGTSSLVQTHASPALTFLLQSPLMMLVTAKKLLDDLSCD